jgi:hypothetical protein
MRRLLLVISAIVVLFSCKKTGDEKKEHKFSFEFNGKKYNDPSNATLALLSGLDLLLINRKDLFGGEIFFYANSSISNNCAYLVPTGEHYVAHLPGCALYDGGVLVDSITTYFYRSGNLKYSKSNCVRKTEVDPATGSRVEYDECDVKGSFSLTLGNKNNQIIAITNGSFSFYGVRL